MAKVEWSDQALAHVEAIAAYIAEFSPLAAQRIALKLLSTGDSLCDSPERGRPVRGGRRELTVIWPYLIRYRVIGDTVFVPEVRHEARRPNARQR